MEGRKEKKDGRKKEMKGERREGRRERRKEERGKGRGGVGWKQCTQQMGVQEARFKPLSPSLPNRALGAGRAR